MAETYCGKSCLECARRQELRCPGCRVGPGREIGGECELARCVRTRGHETCDTCMQHSHCGMHQGRDRQPDYRKKLQENRAAEQRLRDDRAPKLAKWLWLLFWLIIPSTLGSLLTQDLVKTYVPGLYFAGQLLTLFCAIASGVILLQLSDVADGYRAAGICALIAGGLTFLVSLLTGGESPVWSLLITLPAGAISLFGQYQKYMTHSAVLHGVDNHLSDDWQALWKWYMIGFAGILLSIPLVLLIPLLGALVALVCAFGLIVVGILELVYLYKTAKTFREYTPALPEG